MRRISALVAMILTLLLSLSVAGCTAKQPPAPQPPAEPVVTEPATPAPPPKPTGPAVVKDRTGMRLVGIPGANFVDWAPSGQTALVEASPGFFRLRLDTRELLPLQDLGSVQKMGWAGPDDLLLVRWSKASAVGELSLRTGEWRPLATVSGQVQICQSGSDWVWVDIKTVRQGGAGSREIGAVYRTPAPKPGGGGAPQPLTGTPVLEQGALLGRLADGSCLLDGMDGRLLLFRPSGELQTLASEFALPEVTRDGQGVIWREKAGNCPDCIELGPGVPFQRLTWWRLDGKRMTADLGKPQVITPLLSPDGIRLIIGHRDFDGSKGTISSLDPQGFHPGVPMKPALEPAGWMHDELLARPAGPEKWTAGSPVYRASDGEQVAEWLTSGVNGSLLVRMSGELRYFTPDGSEYRLSHPEPFLEPGQGIHQLGIYQSQAPYVMVRQDDGLLLVSLERP